MFFKRFAKIIIFFAIIMFFTPFVMASCSSDFKMYDVSLKEESTVKLSGIDLMIGNFENEASDDEFIDNLGVDTNEFKTNIWLDGAFLCGIAALIILFTQKTDYISAALSAVSVFLLIIFKTSFISYYNLEDYINLFDVEFQLGFKLCIASMVMSVVCCFLSQREEDKEKLLKDKMEDNDVFLMPEAIPKTQACERQPTLSKTRLQFDPKTHVERTTKYNGTLSVEDLLKRAKIFIEDKDWEKACEYCQNALDVDAGSAEAYFAKFMAEYNISDEDKISFVCGEMAANLGSLFTIESYKKASLFGDESFKTKLKSYNQQAIYNYAVDFLDNCTTPEECDRAKVFFIRIPDYLEFMDVNKKIEQCDDKKNTLIYGKAVSSMNLSRFEEAITFFERIPNYNDSQQKVKECKDLINQKIYDSAVRLLNNYEDTDDIFEAQKRFLSIAEYKDSKEMANRCSELRTSIIYNMACDVMDDISCEICIDDVNVKECLSGQLGDIKDNIKKNLFLSKTDALHIAKDMFMSVSEYSDSKDKAEECDKKIELLRNEYNNFIGNVKIAAIASVIGVLLLCIIIPIVRNISDRKVSNNTITSSYENETAEIQDTSAQSYTQQQSETVAVTTAVKYDKNSETDKSVGEFILYNNTYDSDTINYIGTYDGWTYFSDVTDIVIKKQLYLYGTVYFCDVSINRINIETGTCENLIKTCCSSSTYDTFTQYYNYDFIIGDDGKLIFNYEDPNSFRIVSSDEYAGKESYYCDSYVLSYDVNTNLISQLCYDVSQSQYFYYNGWLLKHFASEEWKHLLIDTIHNETYEDSDNCWVKGYDGKYFLLTNGDSFYVINTNSSEIAEYRNVDLDFIYIQDRGDYVYLLDENGAVKYILDMQKQSCSDSIPFDSIETFLPDESRVLGENNIGLIYKKNNYICLTSDYHNADFYQDRIFNLKNVIESEKEMYMKYDTEYEFDDIFYYHFNVCGNWIIINTSINTIDIYYENHYYLNSETGICSNLPITEGTGQYKDVSNYISDYNEFDDFEFSIGYVTIDSGVLNVRSDPSYDSNIIGTLENNSKVEIYEYENGWYFIYYCDYDTNLYGYVSSDYITIR